MGLDNQIFSRRPTMAANVFWEAAYVDARLPIEWRSGAGLTFCCPSFVAMSRGDMKRPTSAASQRECFKSHARCGGRAQRQLIAGVQRLGRLQKTQAEHPSCRWLDKADSCVSPRKLRNGALPSRPTRPRVERCGQYGHATCAIKNVTCLEKQSSSGTIRASASPNIAH